MQSINGNRSVGGCLVIDFHQEHFQEEAAPGVGKVYHDMLDTIAKDQDVAVMTINDVWKIIKIASGQRP